jgi:hypothetical protein
MDTGIGPTGCERMLSTVTSSLLLAKTRALENNFWIDMTGYDFTRFAVGPIPVSMFHEDGTIRKFCKSDLVKQFEKEVSLVLSLPDFDPSLTTYIRDGMAVVQYQSDCPYKGVPSHRRQKYS